LTIVGVRIFGKDREVFITDTTQGGTQGSWQRRLRVGDQVAGYTIKLIESTSVTLTSPSGDQVNMPLTIEKAKGSTPARPPQPGRPAVAGQPPSSPAAGSTASSPAAGVPVRSPTPVPPPVPGVVPPPPGAPPVQAQQGQPQIPTEVQKKLEQLRHNEKTPRLGRKP
jgi:hypothetical protein